MMKRLLVLVVAVACVRCYAEWDVPAVQRTDPCTHVAESRLAYVRPTCPNPPAHNPRDADDIHAGHR